MNQSHYPSLELCKKLTEVGFPDTQLCWYEGKNDKYQGKIPTGIDFPRSVDSFYEYRCPAVIEMLDVMPHVILGAEEAQITIINDGADFIVSYDFIEQPKSHCERFYRGTLPNALAEMILWLNENNYITFK